MKDWKMQPIPSPVAPAMATSAMPVAAYAQTATGHRAEGGSRPQETRQQQGPDLVPIYIALMAAAAAT